MLLKYTEDALGKSYSDTISTEEEFLELESILGAPAKMSQDASKSEVRPVEPLSCNGDDPQSLRDQLIQERWNLVDKYLKVVEFHAHREPGFCWPNDH